MNVSLIVMILVIALLCFFFFWGAHRGFLRIVLTTMALVVTVGVSAVLVPWFSGVLKTTAVGKTIETKINEYVDTAIANPVTESVKDVQDKVIDNLPLPQFIKKDFSEENNPAGYLEFQVTSFTDYLKTRLSTLGISIAAYIILMLLIYIILRILLAISKAISKAPIIGGINRFFGAIFGLIEGLLIIWCLCIVVMLISGTPFGRQVIDVIEANGFLKFLYDNNGILFAANLIAHSVL